MKIKTFEFMSKNLKPGMLTYEDAEPVRVRKPEIIMEPVPRRGLLGRIKDRILGPVMKPHAVMVLSKEERELLKEYMENPEEINNAVKACALTADDIKKATDRIATLARETTNEKNTGNFTATRVH